MRGIDHQSLSIIVNMGVRVRRYVGGGPEAANAFGKSALRTCERVGAHDAPAARAVHHLTAALLSRAAHRI